jgi:hypothetical protein
MPATDRERFTLDGFYDGETRGDGPGDDALETAKVWTLHVAATGRRSIEELRDAAVTCLGVYEVIGGDSWQQWCEPLSGGPYDEPALHISFRAEDLATATVRARAMCSTLGTRPGVLSTAGDWAEQAPEGIG